MDVVNEDSEDNSARSKDVHFETKDTSVLSPHGPDRTTCRIDIDSNHETSNMSANNEETLASGSSLVRRTTNDSSCESDIIPVCENGVLDLSRRGLNKINRKFRKVYADVRKLIISGNMFASVVGFDMFKQCVLVDATDNRLTKLTSFIPFATQLRVLLLSNNGITNIDCLRSFVNLETLDVSCNDIETVPSGLDNAHLLRLDLSSNALKSLPDLFKLSSLNSLDVSSNRISSLKTVTFPQCLAFLDIASNNIEDLTEFFRLLPLVNLESISLANNPCISSPTFDYRIYILSVLPSLQVIDGFITSEEEQLKGEWLYSQGKGRTFKPDTEAHVPLIKYLEKYCPFAVDGKRVSSLDQSIAKVMEKRREMFSNSGVEDDSSLSLSLHSPYGAWAAHIIEGKENQLPNSSADENNLPHHSFSAKMPQSSTPATTKCVKSRTVTHFEPLSRSSTLESVESSSTVTLVPAVKGHRENNQNTPSTAITARSDRSGRSNLRERVLQHEQISELNDEPGHAHSRNKQCAVSYASLHPLGSDVTEVSPTKPKLNECSNDRYNSSRSSSVAVVTDISMDMGWSRNSRRLHRKEDDVLCRITFLEDRLKELSNENGNLTRMNDELSRLLVEMTDKFKEDINSLRTQLESIKNSRNPDPCNLRVYKELGEGCYEIIWDMPVVNGYKVLTNGIESGVIRAPNNACRIADIEVGDELSIQLQAIHLDGTLGEPSNSLIIRRSRGNNAS